MCLNHLRRQASRRRSAKPRGTSAPAGRPAPEPSGGRSVSPPTDSVPYRDRHFAHTHFKRSHEQGAHTYCFLNICVKWLILWMFIFSEWLNLIFITSVFITSDIYYQLAFLTRLRSLPTSRPGLPCAVLPLPSCPGLGHRSAREVVPFDSVPSIRN